MCWRNEINCLRVNILTGTIDECLVDGGDENQHLTYWMDFLSQKISRIEEDVYRII